MKTEISDVRAVRSAVAELIGLGAQIELLENVIPRMYTASQHNFASPLVLRVKNGRYDVALDRQPDGKYTLAFDTWGGDIFRELGNAKATGLNQAVGKFLQTYAKHAAINAATAKGYFVNGCTTDAKGNINLILNVPN